MKSGLPPFAAIAAVSVALFAMTPVAIDASARNNAGEPERPGPPEMEKGGMVLTLLGTAGGPQARKDRSQPANLLVIDGHAYLFDIGDGTVRRLAQIGMTTRQIRAAFVTHLHTDHVAGIPALIMFRWMYQMTGAPLQAMPLIGPPGTSAMTDGAMQFARLPSETLRAQSPSAPGIAASIVARDAAPGLVYTDDKIRVTAVDNSHYDAVPIPDLGIGRARSYAYRVDSAHGSIVFTGDTGVSKAVTALARDADVLVAEVIDLPAMAATLARIPSMPKDAAQGILAHMEREHLSPVQIGDLAREARVGKVVLSHIANADLTPTQTTALGTGVAARFGGPVIVGEDLMTLAVGSTKKGH